MAAGASSSVGKAQTPSYAVSQPGLVSSRHGKHRSAPDMNRDESILYCVYVRFFCATTHVNELSASAVLWNERANGHGPPRSDADQAGTYRLCLCALYMGCTETAICDSQTLKSVPLVRVMPVETLQTSRTRSWREEECQANIPVEPFLVRTEPSAWCDAGCSVQRSLLAGWRARGKARGVVSGMQPR